MSKYRSSICEAVHEAAKDMHSIGIIHDDAMRKFDALCLAPVPSYTSEMVRNLRSRLDITQAVLASVLNTSASTVQKWEIGNKKPGGPSCKLLHLLDRRGLAALL